MHSSNVSTHGMAVAPHHLASQSALAILREGGSAIEAMVAAAAAIAVVYPHMNGLGGDGFWLIVPPEGDPIAIDASGAAGSLATLDAGRPDLMEHHPAGSFQQVLLTHYHLDHVQGLFPLRWGVGASIPVYGPPDDAGCDDLLKHPGLLDFSHTVTPFVMFNLQGLRVTPLPLNHSKLTFGYLLESAHSRLAWLSDTAGLPDKSLKFLLNNRPQAMIIDCSHEPRAQTPRNHNDLNTVRSLNQVIGCPRVILTHISHQFDVWMMDNPLPTGFEAGYDGMEIALD